MALSGEDSLVLEEQAALRRVATLVARGVPAAELFAAVTEEVGRVLLVDVAAMARFEADNTMTPVAVWSASGKGFPDIGTRHELGGQNTSTLVFQTGRPARIDAYPDASDSVAGAIRNMGVRCSVGAPIWVEGRLWGVIHAASTRAEPLPADTEARLASFTELVATAIADAESRAGLAQLADEQAALRRVATLVAHGGPPEEVFAAVTQEVGRLLGTDFAGMARYDTDDTVTVLATWAAEGELTRAHPLVPGPWPLEGGDLASAISRTGRPVRIDDYDGVPGRIAEFVRKELGVRSSVGSPIVVEGRLWGALFLHSRQTEPLPGDTESRLTGFTELVATAVANTQARAELGLLAEEQAALRRVATLVAREASPTEVFSAVTEELGRLLGADIASLLRLEPGNTATVLAAWSESEDGQIAAGTSIPLEGESLATGVLRTGRTMRAGSPEQAPPRIAAIGHQLGVTSTVATPIVVEGRMWGGMSVSSKQPEPLPLDTEPRIAAFAELVAAAIANAENRAELAASRARIVAAADESRRRIERDLHDGAQQRLVHAVIALKLALRALSNAEPNAGELVAEALSHAEQANSELRELAHGILPAALSRGGLKAGVEGLVSRVSLPVGVDVLAERLPASVEATAYFVISEALTNAVKHARATGAQVMARLEQGELRVEVRDDGVGGAQASHGTGLGGLEDRVSALDGRLAVDSPPGGGTCVCARLPVPDARSAV